MKHLMYLLCVLLLLCACAEGTVGTENQPAESSATTQENSFSVSENGSIEQSSENSSTEGSDEQGSEESSGDESSEPSEPKEQKELFDGAAIQEIDIDGGIFRVEQIKKHFNGDDLVLLYIKNLTDNDYSVTIEGSYLDKDGNVILTEAKTFLQFYADYENYFLFRPETEFEDFSYTLSFDEAQRLTFVASDGSIQDIRADDIQFEFCFLNDEWDVQIRKLAIENQDHNPYPTISAYLKYGNRTTYEKRIYMDWVLYNDRGEIIAVFARSQFVSNTGPMEEIDGYSAFHIYQTVKDELVWPEMFLGEIKGIGCVHEVDHYPDEYEHKYNNEWYDKHYDQGTILDLEK